MLSSPHLKESLLPSLRQSVGTATVDASCATCVSGTFGSADGSGGACVAHTTCGNDGSGSIRSSGTWGAANGAAPNCVAHTDITACVGFQLDGITARKVIGTTSRCTRGSK